MIGWLVANWAEVLGFGTGAVCVALAALRNVWNFPIGIANNLVFIWLFTGVALYADAGLQVVYLVLAVQGWLAWARRGDHDASRPDDGFARRTPARAWPLLLVAGLAATGVLAWVLHRFTDSTAELADATTTAFSLVAQVMMNRRWIESWFVWIAVDVALVGLFAVKELYVTSALYVGFIGLCVAGYLRWRQGDASRDVVAGPPGTPAAGQT